MYPEWSIITGDCLDILPGIGDVDALACDPPYSETVHKNVRTAARRLMPDVQDKVCRTRRTVDLGFEHLGIHLRQALLKWSREHVKRWTAVFSDVESVGDWRTDMLAAGLKYRRTVPWWRRGGAPQFNGMCPASSFECVVLAHAPGRCTWNGGGHARVYDYPVVCNRKGQQGTRFHPTQKPLELMRAIVRDFTNEGDLVVDPFCGVGTTVLACVLEGRRCIGIERSPEWAEMARERVTSELRGIPYRRVLGSIAEMAPRPCQPIGLPASDDR